MKIAVLPGDGIGKEVVPVAVDGAEVGACPKRSIVPVDVGQRAIAARRHGDDRRGHGCHPRLRLCPVRRHHHRRQESLQERDTVAADRCWTCTPTSGRSAPAPYLPFKVDFTIYRENSEDLYCGHGGRQGGRGRLSTRKITRQASERIAKAACMKPGHQKAHHRP